MWLQCELCVCVSRGFMFLLLLFVFSANRGGFFGLVCVGAAS